MFYDLGVPWPVREAGTGKKKKGKPSEEQPRGTDALHALPQADQARLTDIATELIELGYQTVAFNQVVHTQFDPALHSNPFARVGRELKPPFAHLDPRTNKNIPRGLTQLSRLTVVLDQESMAKSGSGFVASNSNALLQYDLLAVTPTTEASFQHACITLSELKPFSIDIISLDLAAAPRLPFHLRRSTVGAALANGVVFEISYSAAVDAHDDNARRNLISGTREVLRVTNGKGVIFSSGAKESLGLRSPYDVMNLAAVLGMTPSAAKDALSTRCQSLVIRAGTLF